MAGERIPPEATARGCPRCGHSLPPEALYCPGCGERLRPPRPRGPRRAAGILLLLLPALLLPLGLWGWQRLREEAALAHLQPLSPETADRLVEVRRIGLGRPQALAFSPDGRLLVVATAAGVERYAFPSGEALPPLEGHTRTVTAVAFSPDGALLASAGRDGTIRLWAMPEGRLQAVLTDPEGAVFRLAFSPEGGLLAAGTETGAVRLWELPGGRLRASRSEHRGVIGALAFSPDGRLLAAADEAGAIRLYEMPAATPRAVLKGHRGAVRSLAFSPDGRRLASVGLDGFLRLWSVREGSEMAAVERPMPLLWVAFASDGRTLRVLAADGVLSQHEAASLAETGTFRDPEGILWTAAQAPDGSEVAALTLDDRILIYEPASGKARLFRRLETRPVRSLAVAPRPSRRTAACWPRRPEMGACRSGSWRAAASFPWSPSPVVRRVWPSPRMGAFWRWEAATGPFVCMRSPPAAPRAS
jgi:WD40 repeat protein